MTEVRTPEINDNTRIPHTVENYRSVKFLVYKAVCSLSVCVKCS